MKIQILILGIKGLMMTTLNRANNVNCRAYTQWGLLKFPINPLNPKSGQHQMSPSRRF